ncbi:hypothetical protein GCM10009570_25470 [Dietzia natronolimnaea]
MKTLNLIISFRRVTAVKQIEEHRASAIRDVARAQEAALESIRRAASAGRKYIVCMRCGANANSDISVYGSRNGWPSGTYCHDPCWKAIGTEEPPESKS